MSQGLSGMTDYYIISTTGKRRIFQTRKKTELKIIFYNILDVGDLMKMVNFMQF
jgi:hypothetical protein